MLTNQEEISPTSAADQAETDIPALETHISASRGSAWQQLREVWEYRDLLYFLVWREVKVRYKQTALGAAWAGLQPLLAMVVFSVFFGRLAKMPSDGAPYPLFAYAALIPWQLFATGLTLSANSLINNQGLIKKVYFPRVIVPIAAVLEGLVDFGVAFVLLIVLSLGYGVMPTLNVVWLPLFVLLTIASALSVGLWLAALNARYRDIRYTITFLTQIWMFATPIVYPSSIVPPEWRLLYSLNPMVGVIEGFRWCLLGIGQAPSGMVMLSAGVVLVGLIGGLAYFRSVEKSIADVL